MIQVNTSVYHAQAPRREDFTLQFSDKAITELEDILTHYPNKKAAILPALWIAQREYGGTITSQALGEVAIRLNRSYAEIEGVATYYTMYNVSESPGKNKIEVCTCIVCMAQGGYRLLDLIKKKLGVGPGETTADGLFTIEEVECLNACDRAPIMQIGPEYYGPVTETLFDEIIQKLKASSESTVIQQADEIVKVQISDQSK